MLPWQNKWQQNCVHFIRDIPHDILELLSALLLGKIYARDFWQSEVKILYIYTKIDQNIIGFEICKNRNHTDNSMYKMYVGVGVHTNMKMYRNI